MSLLIDALRKAEQARLESELQGTSAAEGKGGLSLAPREPVDAPGLAPLEPSAPPAAKPPEQPSATPGVAPRAAARKLFEAKQAPRQRLFLPLVAGFTTLAVVLLGAYLWWELQPRGLVTANPPGGPAMAGARPAAAPLAPPETTEAPLPGQAGAPQPATSQPPAPQLAAPSAAIAESPPPARREPPPARGSFAPPAVENPPASGLGPIRKGSPDPGPPAALANAYAAYNAGDLDRASGLYREVLAQEPNNRDALDGMGAIALRQGKEAEAEAWFRRSLAADPNDPVALAGLTALRARNQPEQSESRMKSLLAAQPQAAPGHFALGNALAAQDRWPEAQQAYFEAHALDPDNPDYLFNLAVSLDRLHQPALARRFYAEALEAAGKRAAGFERGAVQARLQALTEAR